MDICLQLMYLINGNLKNGNNRIYLNNNVLIQFLNMPIKQVLNLPRD